MVYEEIVGIIVGLLAAITIMKFLKKVLYLVANTIAGIIGLFAVNALTPLDIPINFFTVLSVILGGVFGLITLVVVSLL